MNKQTEELAKEVLRKVSPQGHTEQELEIVVNAFAEIASRIEDRQRSLPRGADWNMRAWIKGGGPVII